MARGLSGKFVVITGAASGIGRATAMAFANEGASLALCDIDEEKLGVVASELRAKGVEVLASRVDVSKADEMRAFAGEVHAVRSAVDVLVNNAGVVLVGGILDTSLEDWAWILAINVWGPIHGCHYFVPKMVARGQGTVINVASAAGLVGVETLAAYSTTKHAVVGLSESLRSELGPKGVRVAAICPSFVRTPIVENARARGVFAEHSLRQRMMEEAMRFAIPPEKVASRIVGVAKGRADGIVPVALQGWMAEMGRRIAPRTLARLLHEVSKNP